ncbi:MAG TPA: AMP-binding protein [Candidatus Omnitrophota bacterium]|nr:AMP-binding protein [Candidatus Omnitrophota bacterium]
MFIKEFLEKSVTRFADKMALVFKGKEVTFQQLKERSLKLANALSERGVSKADKIAIYLPNCPEYVYSYLACLYLGGVAVPLDFMLKEDELTSCLEHCEAKVLIAMPRNEVELEKIKQNLPSLETVILCADIEGLIAQAQSDVPQADIKDSDPSLIMYTSGTTGRPKGILLNYKHLEGSPAAMDHFVDLSNKDIKICAIPLSHIGGFIYIQNCIQFGITLILMDRFNPFEFLSLVQQHHVTCFHIVPPMYNALLTLKEIERFNLSSLRWVVVFGAPSSPEIMARFHKYCPNARLLNGWGMTETCPPNTVTPLDSDNITSVGKPAPNCKIKIVDDDGQEVTLGQVGEIVISGWIVMDGYYKDPEATAEVKKRDGLYTGDLGRFDEKGFLYIVGRKKEMIKVGGQIVYAPEVEAALYKHEAVAECAVVGVPDRMKGEAVKAYVVLKEGMNVSPEEIRYFARQHLANFKVPHTIELRLDLPKNRTGKVDKGLLKQEALT